MAKGQKYVKTEKKKVKFLDFVLQYQKVCFGILFFIFFLALAYGIWFGLTHSREVTFVFKNTRTFATNQIVAGLPVKLVTLVDANEIKNGKHLVKIPKTATDITVKKITPEEIKALKTQQTSLTPEQKLSIARSVKPIAKSDYPKNLLSSLVSGAGFLLADGEQAVENVISAIAPDSNSQLVDVSSATEQVPEQTPSETVDNSEPTPVSPSLTENIDTAEQQNNIESSLQENDASILENTSPTPEQEIPQQETPIDEPAAPTHTGCVEGEVECPQIEVSPVSTDTEILDTTSPSTEAVVETPDITQEQAEQTQQPCQGDATDNCIAVLYTLPAPTITEQATDTGKLVTISDKSENPQTPLVDVLASTKIPEIYKVGQEDKIKIKWQNNGNQEMQFNAYDTNGNGKLDYVEWTVPHLSEQIFDIIFISKAFRLDADKNITEDIYEYVQTQDGNWVTMNDGEYVRATFEQILDNTNDITIYVKPPHTGCVEDGGCPRVEVYPVYTDADGNQTEGSQLDLVNDGANPDFSNIDHDGRYRILLQNLATPTDVFDLKITGDIDFDYIMDPTFTSTKTGTFNIGTTWGGTCTSSCVAGTDFPGTTDIAVINSTVTMDSARTVAGLTVNSGKTFALSSYATTVLGDVTVDGTISGTGALTLTGASNTIYSTADGTISSPVALGATYTVDVASTKTLTISGVISGSGYGISKTSAGQLTLSGANTFTGGLIIKAGIVNGRTNVYAFGGSGTGAVTIGDSSGSSDAKMAISISFANPITVAAGSSGTLSIDQFYSSYGPSLSGGIVLNNNLTLLNSTSDTYNITGGITGTGNITVNLSTTSNLISITTTTVNMTGTITNLSASTGGLTISAVIGPNVTGVIQNSPTSPLTLSGANSSYAGGILIKSGTVLGQTSANAFGANTNVITIGDTSGTNSATLKGRGWLTFANPITVAAGSSGILSIIGSGFGPTFSGAITLNNNVVMACSTGNGAAIFTGGITGTGNITISSTGTAGLTLSTTSVNNIGTITNSSTGSGITTISSVIGANVTGVIQNSSTSQLTLTANNTFTSGLTIKAGTVVGGNNTSANAFGANSSVITLGDTSGSADATVNFYLYNGTFTNPITTAAGSSGTLTITVSRGVTLSGAITLNNDLTLFANNYSLKLTGGITGNGNILINSTGTGNGYTIISTNPVNMIGTITNSGTSTNGSTISSVIGTNVTGLIQNSATSQLTLSAANTFTSGLTIKSGTVVAGGSANNFGANSNVITLGDSSGNANATLLGRSTEFSNPITVASGSSGTLSIGYYSTVPTFSGTITLNNNLTINGGNNGSIKFSGGVVGTGNLIINNASSSGTTISSGTVDFTGTITNSGAGTGATTISSVIGTNVTGLIQNSSTSALTLSGNNSTVNGNITITSGTLALSGSTNLNVAGNWSNSGTFTANTSTVTLTGSNQKILGTTTFYNLKKDVSAGSADTLMFENSKTQSIANSGTLTLKGASGKILTLRSCDSSGNQSDGTQWLMGVSNTSTTLAVDYVDVKDSNASTKTITATNSLDSGNNTNWSGLTSANTLPTVSSVAITYGAGNLTPPINLTAGTTTTVTAIFTVTDVDGCADIDSGATKTNAVLYRTALGASCTPNNANCYAMSCNITTSCATSTTDIFTCTAQVQFYADATDTGSPYAGTTWSVTATPEDNTSTGGTTASNTAVMNSLTALSVTSSINYSSLALGANTGTADQTTVITNVGNRAIDTQVGGYGQSSNDGYSMVCTFGHILLSYEGYSTAAGTAYASKISLVTDTSPATVTTNISAGASSTKNIYWGMGLPMSGVGSSCTGHIIFTAVNH